MYIYICTYIWYIHIYWGGAFAPKSGFPECLLFGPFCTPVTPGVPTFWGEAGYGVSLCRRVRSLLGCFWVSRGRPSRNCLGSFRTCLDSFFQMCLDSFRTCLDSFFQVRVGVLCGSARALRVEGRGPRGAQKGPTQDPLLGAQHRCGRPPPIYIYIYIYVYIYMCVYIYIYVYTFIQGRMWRWETRW